MAALFALFGASLIRCHRGEWLSQVGQRNINVIGGAPAAPKVTPFEVSASSADETRVSVEITRPEMTAPEMTQILWSSGLPPALARTDGIARVGLSQTPVPAGAWWQTQNVVLDIPGGESRHLFLVTEIMPGAQGFEIFNAVAVTDGRQTGGIATLIVRGIP